MRHRGGKLAAVEAHWSAGRIDAGTIGIPLGHDECLSRNEPCCKRLVQQQQNPKVMAAASFQARGCTRRVNVGVYRVSFDYIKAEARTED